MKTKKITSSNQTKTPVQQIDVETRVAALESRLARTLADYQNLEKRFERESASIVKFANSALLERLLEIRDHLSAAATHFKDPSLTMILSSIDRVLSDEGVSEIDCSGHFDPATMECQEIVAGDKDKVISVIRLGYKLHDRVLRTARVNVGNGQSAGANQDLPDQKVIKE